MKNPASLRSLFKVKDLNNAFFMLWEFFGMFWGCFGMFWDVLGMLLDALRYASYISQVSFGKLNSGDLSPRSAWEFLYL